MVGRPAPRANEAVGPSKPLKVVEAGRVIREPGAQVSIAARIIPPRSKAGRMRLAGCWHPHILCLQHSHGYPLKFIREMAKWCAECRFGDLCRQIFVHFEAHHRHSAHPFKFFGFFLSHCFFEFLYCIPISLWPLFQREIQRSVEPSSEQTGVIAGLIPQDMEPHLGANHPLINNMLIFKQN
jgi:hypothetical protein